MNLHDFRDGQSAAFWGVVDFIDCYFFGILGMERWPTFNVADAVVVVCGILFVLAFILQIKSDSHAAASKKQEA